MYATSVARLATLLKIVEEKMCILKAKWPQGDKLLRTPKEGKVKLEEKLQISKVDKAKLEEDKLPRTTVSMHYMVVNSMRMCPMLSRVCYEFFILIFML